MSTMPVNRKYQKETVTLPGAQARWETPPVLRDLRTNAFSNQAAKPGGQDSTEKHKEILTVLS